MMGKIVGNPSIYSSSSLAIKSTQGERFFKFFKLFFVTLILLPTVLSAEITLTLRDIDGNRTKRATVGKPFLLDVHMRSQGGTMRYPTIDGLENFAVHKSGFQLNTVNGASSSTYTYQVRIDKPGDYVLGPAHFMTTAGKQESNIVKISVSEQTEKTQGDRGKGAFLQLTVNKQKVFVGEKVLCSLRFYYTNNGTNVRSIGGPDEQKIVGITFQEHKGPLQGQEEIDGVPYDYIEWHWDAAPTQSGQVVIPAYFVDYHVEKRNASNRFAGLLGFFGHRVKQKRTYSNALTIEVEPLPPTDKKIVGVGTIENFWAHLKPSAAKQGEGMVLTLGVQGDIDLSLLDINELENVPESFKWYESKQQILDDTKSFEFIIQGLEPGDWQIPPQQLTYFDVVTKKYKTVRSDPLAITIVNDPTMSNASVQTQTEIDISNKTRLQPLDYSDVWYNVEKRAIPWPWFVGVLLLAFVLWSLFFLRLFLRNDSATIQKKYAFAHARKKLRVALRIGKTDALYNIFMYTFSARMEIPVATLSQDIIEQLLRESGFDNHRIEQWNHFFAQLQEYSFSYAEQNKELFEQAQQWLDELESML